MSWTSYLPNDPNWLSKWEWRFWLFAAGVGLLGLLSGYAAYVIGRHRGEVEQTILQDKLSTTREELDEKNRELEKTAGEARQKAAEVEARQMPRRLTTDQRTKLLSLLSSEKGMAVTITSPLGDLEARTFAEDLLSVLKEAGWSVDGLNQALYTESQIGLRIFVKDPSNSPPGAVLLADSLHKAGLQFTVFRVADDFPPLELGLVVGHKPR